MAKLGLGTAASGVETPSRPEGEVLAADVPVAAEEKQMDKGKHRWLVFGRSNSSQSYALQDVPCKMEGVLRRSRCLWNDWIQGDYRPLLQVLRCAFLPSVAFSRVVKAYMLP